MAGAAERAFFEALAACQPGVVRYNGDAGEATAALRALGLAFPNNHWEAGLPSEVEGRLGALLQSFGGSRRDWPAASLLARVDGLITGQPLGPCLVEFDEEQHFSPYRSAAIDALAGTVEMRFDAAAYRRYCTDPDKFREFWRKSRLPSRLLPPRGLVTDKSQLAAILFRNQGAIPDSGYIRAKVGFPFAGGRIAQRAYYDALRDCIHLAEGWRGRGFRPVLRVAVWDLEARLGGGTGRASAAALRKAVEDILARYV